MQAADGNLNMKGPASAASFSCFAGLLGLVTQLQIDTAVQLHDSRSCARGVCQTPVDTQMTLTLNTG